MRRIAILGTIALVMCGLAATHAVERLVTWEHLTNVTVRSDFIEKTAGCQGCEDAGAASQQAIRQGDGYVEFTAGEANTLWAAGLGRGDDSTRYSDIEFAFRFNGAGRADVLESGSYQSGDTTYKPGDRFRVEVTGGKVRYLKNGQVIRESGKAPAYPLALDVSLQTVGATVRNARIETHERELTQAPPSWPNPTEARSDGFTSMDYNRDGVLSREEWRESARDFDQRDTNGDEVITRGEFLGNGTVAGGTSRQMIRVDPNREWTDSGIFVTAGDTVIFEPDGSADLIARIGDSGPIAIGQRRSLRASISGRLYLGVNDRFTFDDHAEHLVRVIVQPR